MRPTKLIKRFATTVEVVNMMPISLTPCAPMGACGSGMPFRRAGMAQAMSPHCRHTPEAISAAVGAALLRGLGMQYDDAGILARNVAADMLGDLL